MNDRIRESIREKLGDAVLLPFPQLTQVAAEIENGATFEREIRALQGAAEEFPAARKVLIAEGTPPRGRTVPEGVELLSIWRWLLDPQMAAK